MKSIICSFFLSLSSISSLSRLLNMLLLPSCISFLKSTTSTLESALPLAALFFRESSLYSPAMALVYASMEGVAEPSTSAARHSLALSAATSLA